MRECFAQRSLMVASLIGIRFLTIASPGGNNLGDPVLTHPLKNDHSETAGFANCLDWRYNTCSGRFGVNDPAAAYCPGRRVLTHPM